MKVSCNHLRKGFFVQCRFNTSNIGTVNLLSRKIVLLNCLFATILNLRVSQVMHAHPIYEGSKPCSHLCLLSTLNVRFIIKSSKIESQFVPRCKHFPFGLEKKKPVHAV
jgi:hypothetical protein